MARKSTLGGLTADKETPPSPTKMTTGDVHGSGAKSGQYPGERQWEGMAEAGVQHEPTNTGQASEGGRGTDPALAGDYVHSAKSNSQGPTPGKFQVKNPNERLEVSIPKAEGQYPGIPVPMTYGEGFDGLRDTKGSLGGATYDTQTRESGVGNVRGGQYPGIPQAPLFAGNADDVRGISKDEGADLNLREVPEDDQNLGGRMVENANPN